MKKLKDLISKNKKQTTSNPYLENRQILNDRYMNLAISKRNWQLAFWWSMGANLVLLVGYIAISLQSKIKPYLIATNQGMPLAIQEANPTTLKDQRVVNYFMNSFIYNTRTILADGNAENNLLEHAKAAVANNALNYLVNYYKDNNPALIAANYTTIVKVINSQPLSDNTWQVIWDEVKYDAVTGNKLETSRWTGTLNYVIDEVNSKLINYNPFGIYITNISWAQNQ